MNTLYISIILNALVVVYFTIKKFKKPIYFIILEKTTHVWSPKETVYSTETALSVHKSVIGTATNMHPLSYLHQHQQTIGKKITILATNKHQIREAIKILNWKEIPKSEVRTHYYM